jgi:hypothetical protein
MHDPEHDALANMASATERRVDELADDGAELEARVRALEATVAKLREEIKTAAHELRDDSSFMRPLSERIVDHGSDHLLGRAGKALLKWIGVIGVGIIIFLAGKWGIIK